MGSRPEDAGKTIKRGAMLVARQQAVNLERSNFGHIYMKIRGSRLSLEAGSSFYSENPIKIGRIWNLVDR
jgi:hypothetical protein